MDESFANCFRLLAFPYRTRHVHISTTVLQCNSILLASFVTRLLGVLGFGRAHTCSCIKRLKACSVTFYTSPPRKITHNQAQMICRSLPQDFQYINMSINGINQTLRTSNGSASCTGKPLLQQNDGDVSSVSRLNSVYCSFTRAADLEK